MIIVGNKKDLEEERDVPAEKLEQLARKHGVDWIESCAKQGEVVEQIFEKLCTQIIKFKALKHAREKGIKWENYAKNPIQKKTVNSQKTSKNNQNKKTCISM